MGDQGTELNKDGALHIWGRLPGKVLQDGNGTYRSGTFEFGVKKHEAARARSFLYCIARRDG